MNYTIAVLEEVHTRFSVDYGKNGNRYYITIADGPYRRTRDFLEVEDAVKVFSTLANAVCKGLYSFEDRIKILMGGDEAEN